MKKKKEPEKIGTIVESVLKERGYLNICKELDVVRAWPFITGKRLAEVSECTRVENGALFVRVPSAPWRQEMSFMKKLLISKIHEETGCMTINDIVFY